MVYGIWYTSMVYLYVYIYYNSILYTVLVFVLSTILASRTQLSLYNRIVYAGRSYEKSVVLYNIFQEIRSQQNYSGISSIVVVALTSFVIGSSSTSTSYSSSKRFS